ncbi:RNA polymerase sigma factor [Luteolibacter marinus]|uniref:RNA polymerase sigma factor n=1 Tax=Luteolibacter marinus TaxID=2776705 RepID=UPI0018694E59|nr:sigma-70 family RNA polymerase sigma factor [Luteolibacter marinus]
MSEDRSDLFLTTRWTLVGEAARTGDAGAKQALGSLFVTYWKPLYRYARRQGKSPEDAEDLVQGFFEHLLEGDGLRKVDRDRGRFRAFMLGSLKNYVASEWRREHRQKRGGFAVHLSLDWHDAETGLGLDAEEHRSPDRWFDKEWATALLDKVLDDLDRDEPGFERWKRFLGRGQGDLSYADVASVHGMSEGAARVAVHRLRKRYRQRVRDEIAGTLADPSMIDDEMRSLFEALTDDFT